MVFTPWIPELSAQALDQRQQENELYAQQLMVKAMTQGFLGYHDKAIPIYKEALNLTPYSATINSALAESYEHLGEYTSALFYAQQALSLDSTELYFHRHLVRLYIQSGDNEMAEASLIVLLQNFPNDEESLSDLVEIQLLNGKLEDALQSNTRLITLSGSRIDVLDKQLELLEALQQWDEYETVLIDREQQDPLSIDFKKDRIVFYIEQDRTNEAKTLLDEALTFAPADPALNTLLATFNGTESSPAADQIDQLIDPSNPEATFQNAQALYDSNPNSADILTSVERILRSLLEYSPDHFEALTLLGTVLYEQQNYVDAAPYLKKAVNQNPRFITLWIQAASSYLQTYKYKEASSLSEEGLLLFPGQLPLLRISAISHVMVYNNSTAMDRSNEYLSLIESTPEGESDALKAELFAYAGLLYGRAEDFERADALYETAMQLGPDNPIVMGIVALGLAERGAQLKKAVDLANRSVEISPNNPLFMGILGRVYFKSNDLTNADKWLTLAVNIDDTLPEVHEYMGDLLLETGNTRDALASWNKALEINPDNPMLSEKVRAHAN